MRAKVQWSNNPNERTQLDNVDSVHVTDGGVLVLSSDGVTSHYAPHAWISVEQEQPPTSATTEVPRSR